MIAKNQGSKEPLAVEFNFDSTQIKTVKDLLVKNNMRGDRLINGILTKKFLETKILNKSLKPLTNIKLKNKLYQSFAFNTLEAIFEFFLDKLNLEKGSFCLVHPMLPEKLVDILINKGIEFEFLKIQKSTLNTTFTLLNLNKKPDGIIYFSFSDLWQEIKECIVNTEVLGVKNLIIDLNPFITEEFFDLVDSLQTGAYIQLTGLSMVPYIINSCTGIELEQSDLYLGWIMVQDTLSALNRNDLTASQEQLKFLNMLGFLIEQKTIAKTTIQKITTLVNTTILYSEDYYKKYSYPIKGKFFNLLGSKNQFDQEAFMVDFYKLYVIIQNQPLADYWFNIYFDLDISLNNWIDKDMYQIQKYLEGQLLSITQSALEIKKLIPSLNFELAPFNRKSCAMLVYSSDLLTCYQAFLNKGHTFYTLPPIHNLAKNDPQINTLIESCLVKKI
jgi:hypothetical protein